MTKSLDKLPEYLRERGFKVVGVPGWRNRKRPSWTGGWRPKGVVAHHTGDRANGLAYAKGILANGRKGLPGPLCQLALNRDGTVIFVAGGRANHAGKVRKIGFLKAGDGNSQSLGIEAMNTGSEGWSTPRPNNPFGTQYASYVALVAAVEDFFDWERGSVLGHGECSVAGKWDPGVKDKQTGANRMLDMGKFRAAVKAVTFRPKPTPPPTPPRDPRLKLGLVNHNAASKVLSKIANLRKWRKRRTALIGEVVSINTTIFGGLECGGGSTLKWITNSYASLGYVIVPNGKGGRHWFRHTSTYLFASGCFEPKSHYKDGNDMPAPWAVLRIGGRLEMFVLSHLDHRDKTRRLQVRQQREIMEQAEVTAKKYGIPKQLITYASDMADNGEAVMKGAFNRGGYADSHAKADKALRTKFKSYNEYEPPKLGPRGDVVVVHEDRDVLIANQRFTLNTDHHHQATLIS